MDFQDYYGILGVDTDAPVEEIRRAYRKLARKFHPDVSDEADAEDRFKEVSEAWDILGDEEKRATYDQMRAYGPNGPSDYSGFGNGGFDAGGAESFGDFFNSMFGGGQANPQGARFSFGGGMGSDPFSGFGAGAHARQAPPSGDVNARLSITLEDAYSGAEKLLRLSVPEPGGQPPRSRTLKVKIPAGVTEGRQIRLRGQGLARAGGLPAGDLFVELSIQPHQRFVLDGLDVTLAVPVTPAEAALGARIQVETLGGAVEVKVPAGTSSGARLRLRGRGLPGAPAGDQYLEFRVVVPKELSEQERALYQQLADLGHFEPRSDDSENGPSNADATGGAQS